MVKLRAVNLIWETDAGDVVENYEIGDISRGHLILTSHRRKSPRAKLKEISAPETAVIEFKTLDEALEHIEVLRTGILQLKEKRRR